MSFEELLLESVDEGLSSLGETCKQALHFHLEKNFKLNKRDIPFRIEEFTEAIENIFGVGAKILQIRIMKNLFKKMEYPFPYLHDRESLEFTKYLDSARVSRNRLCCFKALKTNQVGTLHMRQSSARVSY